MSHIEGEWLPEVERAFEELIRRHGRTSRTFREGRPPVAAFDWDNTCIYNDIGEALFFHLTATLGYRFDLDAFWDVTPLALGRDRLREQWARAASLREEERVGHPDYLAFRARFAHLYFHTVEATGPRAAYEWSARLLVGATPAGVIAETEAVIRAELRARLREEVWASCDDVRVAVPRGIRVFGAVARLQERLRSAGFEVWVVSASPRLAVVPFARRIGVEDERVLGMREVVRDGVLSSDLEGPPTYGEGKVMALMRAAGRGPLMAVGDAVTDAEMLGAACAAGGLAVLLDRGDPALRALARERGWLVQPRWIASAV